MTRSQTVVQRVLFPQAEDADARDLYVRGKGLSVLSRSEVRMDAGARMSTATYFGAFASAYWRRLTDVRRVALQLSVEGSVTVEVWGTDENGNVSRLAERGVDRGGRIEIEVELTHPASGRLWFDAHTDDGAVLRDIHWLALDSAPHRAVTAAIAITTFDRVPDCMGVLQRIADAPELRSQVRRVTVADQGSHAIADDPAFAVVQEELGEELRVVRQPNLGGSGGFSRGMIEGVDAGATHVLLLDDDVRFEPESVRRMLDFVAFARTETIVGAHMLHLDDPTRLHSYGERIDRRSFWWTPVVPELSGANLAEVTVETTPALSGYYPVDFNGWWMCLVPSDTIRRIGGALPVFIKWDDAEFGLRAHDAGTPTVTLPGAAVWHMPWTNKDDGLDWQAFHHVRNRLVAALLHSGRRRGGALLPLTFAEDVNHILCLQYGSAAVRHLALRDVLAGPSTLGDPGRSDPALPRAVIERFGHQRLKGALPPARERFAARPHGLVSVVRRAVAVVARQLRRPRPSGAFIDIDVPRSMGKWWSLGVVDSAVLRSATGQGGFILRRRRGDAIRLVVDALTLRVRLWWAWPRLRRAYRRDLPTLTGLDGWRRRIALAERGDPFR